MGRSFEKGEGQLGGIVMLLLIAALAWAAWNVAPVYIDHYSLQDKIVQVARTPRYKAPTDEKVVDLLMKEVRERGMLEWIERNNFQVLTTETNRRVTLTYLRTATVLPGWERTFELRVDTDQPLI